MRVCCRPVTCDLCAAGTASAPVMLLPLENVTVLDGQDATLTCRAKGAPPPDTRWLFNGEPRVTEGSSGVTGVTGGHQAAPGLYWPLEMYGRGLPRVFHHHHHHHVYCLPVASIYTNKIR